MRLKRNFTKLAFRLHGWLGLTAGFFFLLFGLTGSMLMFRHELDRCFNPEVHQLKPGRHQVTADEIYRMIVCTHPNLKKIVLHDFPADRCDSYEFMVYKNQQQLTENHLYYIAVNPYTGTIIKEGNYSDISPSFFRWLYSFHYSLQAGTPGKAFTAFVGLLMLFSLLTGIIIYRKHFWDALRFKAGLNFKNGRTTLSSLHRIIGVWSMLFTGALFFTGFWMNRESFASSAWKLNKPHKNYLVPVNINSLVSHSVRTVKGFRPIAVDIPAVQGQDVLVKGQMPSTTFALLRGKASSFAYDAKTGRLKAITIADQLPFSKRFDREVYQLHIGGYGGTALKCLYVLLGLLPGVLSVTGACLWMKRKKVHFNR